ncbi:DUF5979 domain-containing protein [Cellulomonas cellasea]|nr:DUF5979 domain-containing protein [Cellulomonas cellasea]MDM8083761.1 DUF5979 domain-containing protein [Cellulomonas cellasea]
MTVSCGGALQDQIVIAARTTTETVRAHPGLPAGVHCTVTETADGSSARVRVTTTAAAPVAVVAGGTVTATTSNAYTADALPAAPTAWTAPGGVPTRLAATGGDATAALSLLALASLLGGALLLGRARRRSRR